MHTLAHSPRHTQKSIHSFTFTLSQRIRTCLKRTYLSCSSRQKPNFESASRQATLVVWEGDDDDYCIQILKPLLSSSRLLFKDYLWKATWKLKKEHTFCLFSSLFTSQKWAEVVDYPLLSRTPSVCGPCGHTKGEKKRINKQGLNVGKRNQYGDMQNIYILINHSCWLLPRACVQACVLALAGLA